MRYKIMWAVTIALLSINFRAAAREISAPIPIVDPAQWITTNDYPMSEVAKGITGISEIEMVIDRDGRVSQCMIKSSSGSDTLDATACALIKVRARFTPGRDATGKKIDYPYKRRIVWQLPIGTAIPIPLSRSVKVIVDTDEKGVVVACRVDNPTNAQVAVDPCLRTPVGAKGPVYADKNGKPVAVRFTQTMTSETEERH